MRSPAPRCIIRPAALALVALAIPIALQAGCNRKSNRDKRSTPPSIVSVDPNRGDVARISLVRITTAGFYDDFLVDTPTVLFDSTPATFVWPVAANAVNVHTPPATGPGFLDVTVQSSAIVQTATLQDAFEYVAVTGTGCSIAAVNPSAGPIIGGTDVTITGSGFTADAQVFFDVLPASNVIFDSASQLRAISPASPTWGLVDVTVSDPAANVSCTAAGAFDYLTIPPPPPCTITSICPNEGSTLGGDIVTIIGTEFAATATVAFGGFASPQVVFISTTEITAETPPIPTGGGPADVFIDNGTGSSCTEVNGFTYRTGPGPAPDAAEPDDTAGTCTGVPPQLAALYTRTIHAGDEDWFCFTVFMNPIRTVTMTPDPLLAGNLDLELYDSGGTLVASSNQPSGPEQVVANGQGNSFTVRVFGVCGAVGPYEIMISD